jgi:hypothetical protein
MRPVHIRLIALNDSGFPVVKKDSTRLARPSAASGVAVEFMLLKLTMVMGTTAFGANSGEKRFEAYSGGHGHGRKPFQGYIQK